MSCCLYQVYVNIHNNNCKKEDGQQKNEAVRPFLIYALKGFGFFKN